MGKTKKYTLYIYVYIYKGCLVAFQRVLNDSFFFFFCTFNLQGLTIQQYKNKKNSKIQIQNKTQTLRKSYTFLNRFCTRRGHININNYNNYNNNKNELKKKKERKKRGKKKRKE